MNELHSSILHLFQNRFQGTPLLIHSPGRVNLIGEHTDYNNGFVLPAAIDKAITLAMNRNDINLIRLSSVDMASGYAEVSAYPPFRKNRSGWANYIIGVVDELIKAGYQVSGFDCVFGGNIPIGAGMSSSAALEGGVVFGLSELYGLDLSRQEMAEIAQKAENRFVGVQCGIMDQFASLHGKSGHVIKLDCRSLAYHLYPFQREDIRIVLCDTKVRRELAGSEYNIRRRQCELGVAVLRQYDTEIQSLRDVSLTVLESHKNELDPVVYRRCRYVLEENERVNQACADLEKGDLVSFGERMYSSHYGLRDDYEVSCRELDILVEASEKLDGVLGSRMMGGGFGGCTINLIVQSRLEESIDVLRSRYRDKTNTETEVFVAKIGDGTHIVTDANETESQ